jgi:hypothetical protein
MDLCDGTHSTVTVGLSCGNVMSVIVIMTVHVHVWHAKDDSRLVHWDSHQYMAAHDEQL